MWMSIGWSQITHMNKSFTKGKAGQGRSRTWFSVRKICGIRHRTMNSSSTQNLIFLCNSAQQKSVLATSMSPRCQCMSLMSFSSYQQSKWCSTRTRERMTRSWKETNHRKINASLKCFTNCWHSRKSLNSYNLLSKQLKQRIQNVRLTVFKTSTTTSSAWTSQTSSYSPILRVPTSISRYLASTLDQRLSRSRTASILLAHNFSLTSWVRHPVWCQTIAPSRTPEKINSEALVGLGLESPRIFPLSSCLKYKVNLEGNTNRIHFLT